MTTYVAGHRGMVGGARHGFLDGVHALRAFAAIAVVLFHSGGSIGSDKYQGDAVIKAATTGLDVGVDLFFVISGFVISLPLFLKKQRAPGAFLVNRAMRILPLSMLTAVIFLGSAWLIFGRVPAFEKILSSVFLLPVPVGASPVVLWTLKQELLFYALFAVTFLNAGLGLVIIALWAALSPVVHVPGSVGAWVFHPQNVQFGFGVLAAWLFMERRGPTGWMAWVLLGAGATGLLAFGFMRHAGALPNGALAILLGLCGLLIVVSTACEIVRIPRWLAFLGSASFSIYLIHFFFISTINKAMVQVPGLPGGVALLCLACFATAGGCVYYLLFEAPLERYRKRRAPRRAALDGPHMSNNK